MADRLSPSARRVQDRLRELGFAGQVVELPAATRTVAEAAAAVGCHPEQIAKSLVFRGRETGRPLLVIVGGANRVDERRLGELAGEPVERAPADFVRERTGFVIGGVPPVGHREPLDTFIDEDLLALEEVWAAAGTPHAVFRLKGPDLPALTDGQIVAIV
ncbi:MAG: YbaK/EbsC family protein [Chloroflexota bacterium]|nr:YbaK/EbsC family protein [Chloroflexota bacterium]